MDGHRHTKHQSVIVIFTFAVLVCEYQVLAIRGVTSPNTLQTASEPSVSRITSLSIISQKPTRLSEVKCLRVVFAAVHCGCSFRSDALIRTVLALFDLYVRCLRLKWIIFVDDLPGIFRFSVHNLEVHYLLTISHVLTNYCAVLLAGLDRLVFKSIESCSLDSVLEKTRLSQLLVWLAGSVEA